MTAAIMIDRLTEKLDAVEARYREIAELLEQPEIATDYGKVQTLAKERASIESIVSLYRGFTKTDRELQEATEMLSAEDEELAGLARQEQQELAQRRDDLAQQIRVALLPRDPNDEKSVIVEVRAGTGGEEAGLFAADLYRMYIRYAATVGWLTEMVNVNESGIGSLKEVVFEVRGRGAYSRLKHESGVHRVQRVPVTEASGRIHTSTATVAVLPEAGEVEVDISPNDLRIDIFHAGGHGGQNVQKVATAVRVVHLPTGITAVCQDERSQLKNKTKAMGVLRARVLDIERRKQQDKITESRRSQVGTGERSEKIRTYNFPQNRVTDHRAEITMHNLSSMLEGDLNPLLDTLVAREQADRLAEAVA